MTSCASHKCFPAEITCETNNPDREEPTSYHSNWKSPKIYFWWNNRKKAEPFLSNLLNIYHHMLLEPFDSLQIQRKVWAEIIIMAPIRQGTEWIVDRNKNSFFSCSSLSQHIKLSRDNTGGWKKKS